MTKTNFASSHRGVGLESSHCVKKKNAIGFALIPENLSILEIMEQKGTKLLPVLYRGVPWYVYVQHPTLISLQHI